MGKNKHRKAESQDQVTPTEGQAQAEGPMPDAETLDPALDLATDEPPELAEAILPAEP